MRYDVLSIDIGSTPKPLPLRINQHSFITPVKPIDNFGNKWENILKRLQSAHSIATEVCKSVLNIAIVGGGGGGTELAFAINHRLKNDFIKIKFKIMLITKGSTLLSSHGMLVLSW